MENYIGKHVRVDTRVTDEKKHSTYNDGRYFVIGQLGDQIKCFKLFADIYDSHNRRSFTVGEDGGEVVVKVKDVAIEETRKVIKKLTKQAQDVIDDRVEGNWVKSVYYDVIENCEDALEALEDMPTARKAAKTIVKNIDDLKVTVTVERV